MIPRGAADRCLHELFEEQVVARPDAIALTHEGRSLTYRELNCRANRLAHELLSCGVGPDTLVGLFLGRCIEMVVAMLGVLKAGGAYVPCDPTLPRVRALAILEDARVPVLISAARWASVVPEVRARVILLDSERELGPDDEPNPVTAVTCDHIAHVVYTSGTTGPPKGTLIPHRTVLGFTIGVEYFRFAPGEVFLQYSSLSWDAMTLELWFALVSGGRCVLHTEGVQSLETLVRAIVDHQVTILWLTSSLFNVVVDVAIEALRGVRLLMTGAEPVSAAHVRKLQARFPDLPILNGYGPSECGVFSCCHLLRTPLPTTATSVPIGRPVGDRRVYVRDEAGSLAPVGVLGELHIGGPGVARGYLGRRGLTAERFVPDPFSGHPGARLYRTGDQARWRSDGTLEFLGRRDQQVKIRGYRIELREIESTLMDHAAVAEAAVLRREDRVGDARLVAYVRPTEHGAALAARNALVDELRGYLRDRLPDFMVPAAIAVLDTFPRTSTGKLDRHALPPPSTSVAQPSEPGSFVEMEVARAMAEILGVSAVSIHDDFFTLGGNSILALRLVAKLQSLFGRELPLARFYDGPTVAEIARCVDAAGSLVESAVPIVRLSTAEHGLRLFCPHAIGADVFSYVELARLVEPTLAIHGIRATRVEDRETPRSVEEMASAYLQAIREIQPAGPYFLAGWSFGGLIAYELAQQLTAVGEEVALLAIIDGRGYVTERISHTLHLLAVLGDLISVQAQEKLRNLPESKQIQYVLEECAARGIPRLRTDLIRIYAANHDAATMYHPQPYSGSAVFVRAINEILPPSADPILYWQRLIKGPLAVHRLPCRHNEILEPPHVSVVGSILLEAVAKTCDHAAPLVQ